MNPKLIYPLNAVGIIAIIAINATVEWFKLPFVGALFIPLAWLLGSWYGRADTVASLKRIVHIDWASGPDRSVVQYRQQGHMPEEKPHPLQCFQHGGGPSADEYNKTHGFTCPKCQEEGAASIAILPDGTDPLDAEKAAASLNKLVSMGLQPTDNIDSSHPQD